MYKVRANNGIGNVVFTTNSIAEAENYVTKMVVSLKCQMMNY